MLYVKKHESTPRGGCSNGKQIEGGLCRLCCCRSCPLKWKAEEGRKTEIGNKWCDGRVSITVEFHPGPVLQRRWESCSSEGCVSTLFSLYSHLLSALRAEADCSRSQPGNSSLHVFSAEELFNRSVLQPQSQLIPPQHHFLTVAVVVSLKCRLCSKNTGLHRAPSPENTCTLCPSFL